jgi:hypothetical protein
MKNSSYWSFFFGFLICLWFSGCASFAGGNLKELEAVPSAPVKSPRASLAITWSTYLNGVHKPANEHIAAGMGMKHALEAFKETGYFSEVGPTVDNPDVKIKVRIKDEGKANLGMAMVTGFTLFLIPSSATDLYVMDAEVTNLKTGQTRSYHLEDSMNYYQQIFLIFIMPFNWPASVVEDVLENMFTHLAVKIHEDGLLTMDQIGTK